MKILHVIDSLAPSYGGPAVSCPSLAAAQAVLGHQVSIAYPADVASPDEIRRVGLQTIANFSALELLPLPLSDSLLGTITSPGMGHWLDSHLADCDFVHVHGIWRPCLAGAIRRCLAMGIPYAVAPRGTLDYWSMEQRWFKKQLAWHLLWRSLVDQAAFVHALNECEQTALMRFHLRCPIVISPNGVARSMLREIEDLTSPEAETPYVLFMSRLHHKKGLDFLAAAFGLLLPDYPDLRLKIAGPDEGALQGFIDQCRSLHIDNHVDVLGPVYGTEKYRLIKGCSVFCLPSRQEGFSVMLAEVLACARPVVISRQCNFPEVETSGAGRVVELDAEAIARALRDFLDDPVRADAAGKYGRTLIRTEYTWEAIAEQMIGEYRKVLQSSSITKVSI